jgi:hypothetical protein
MTEKYPGLLEWPILMPDGTTSILWLPEDKRPPPGWGIQLVPIEGRPGVHEIHIVQVTL